MKIAIAGCTHGRIETIYNTIAYIEETQDVKIDLLLCCGDFQALRNEGDFSAFACPKKYHELGSFYKYYSGEKTAPVLTLIIGGNHEASNFFQELPYGGWLAPNMYYLGYAGVVKYGGLRIAGVSGIYNAKNYRKGHFECVPYDNSTKRSVYHLRSLEIHRLLMMEKPVDIMLSHDWPTDIHHFGNTDKLLRMKPYAADQIQAGDFGGPPLADVLHNVQPRYWFAAHYHVKFAALVKHQSSEERTTQFLSLDKCLPKRPFLQIVDIEGIGDDRGASALNKLEYDPEWLDILQKTDSLNKLSSCHTTLPKTKNRNEHRADEGTILKIISDFGSDLKVPVNFVLTAPPHGTEGSHKEQPLCINPQTKEFCSKLNVTDPSRIFGGKTGGEESDSDEKDVDVGSSDNDFEIVFE